MSFPFDTPGSRSFFLIWLGLTISLLGSGLTSFALGVWIFQETASTTQYALVMFCAALPPLVVLPLVGPMIDRFRRKRLLIGCDLIAAAATLAVGLLAANDRLNLVTVCLIVIITSSVAALQWPTYSATVTLLVPREQFGRASGMTQLAQALSQIAAPAVAGALMGLIGLLGITVIDLATFLVSTVLLVAASIPEVNRGSRERRSYWRDLPVGWRCISASSGLLALLLMFTGVNFFSELATVLYTPLVLSLSDPAALGTIVAIGGFGLLLGGALMTIWGGPPRPALGAAAFAALSGVAIAASALTRSVPILSALAALFFFCIPLMSGCSQVVWQRAIPAELQGRVFAARAAIAMSAMPLASLAAGPLADQVFEPALVSGGSLAHSLGGWIGVGPGRGIAAILLCSGLLAIATAAIAAAFRPLQQLDHPVGAPTELPTNAERTGSPESPSPR
ncbi:MAG: MFS transporter [Candidatus Eisenbacteria bacterium]|nr:MFS transporter [Candidatus Eisenbacteria bacterium]